MTLVRSITPTPPSQVDVTRVQARDPDETLRLLRSLHQVLRSQSSRPSETDIQLAAIDALMEILSPPPGDDVTASPPLRRATKFLARLTRRRAKDKAAVRHRAPDALSTADVWAGVRTETPSEILVKCDRLEVGLAAVRELGPDAEQLMLEVAAGRSQAALADELGVPAAKVRKQVLRARTRARNAIERAERDPRHALTVCPRRSASLRSAAAFG